MMHYYLGFMTYTVASSHNPSLLNNFPYNILQQSRPEVRSTIGTFNTYSLKSYENRIENIASKLKKKGK